MIYKLLFYEGEEAELIIERDLEDLKKLAKKYHSIAIVDSDNKIIWKYTPDYSDEVIHEKIKAIEPSAEFFEES